MALLQLYDDVSVLQRHFAGKHEGMRLSV
jgi:hypothetical protein